MQITQTRQEEGCVRVCRFCRASVLTLWALFHSPDEKNRRWLGNSSFFSFSSLLLSALSLSLSLFLSLSLSFSLSLGLYTRPSGFLCLYTTSINIYNISDRGVLCFHWNPLPPPLNFSHYSNSRFSYSSSVECLVPHQNICICTADI